MSLFNWFASKPETPIEELEELVAKPAVELPEPTRKELFDSAVREVKILRVQELIHRDMVGKIHGYGVLEDTLAALKLGTRSYVKDSAEYDAVLAKFPEANFVETTGGWDVDTIVTLQSPSISAEDIAKFLAEEYVGA